jgi:hypothetical protein
MTRAAILAALDRKLAHGDKALVSNKGFRRFVKTIASGNFSVDHEKVETDAKFDGLFALRTNTKLSALQVILRYRHLLAVDRELSSIDRKWRWRRPAGDTGRARMGQPQGRSAREISRTTGLEKAGVRRFKRRVATP